MKGCVSARKFASLKTRCMTKSKFSEYVYFLQLKDSKSNTEYNAHRMASPRCLIGVRGTAGESAKKDERERECGGKVITIIWEETKGKDRNR